LEHKLWKDLKSSGQGKRKLPAGMQTLFPQIAKEGNWRPPERPMGTESPEAREKGKGELLVRSSKETKRTGFWTNEKEVGSTPS